MLQPSYYKYCKNFLYKNISYTDSSLKKNTYKYFIVIPVYNELHYIHQTLQSINIQNQKLLNDSLIILVINNSIKEKSDIIQNNYDTHRSIEKNKYNFEIYILDYYSKDNALAEKYSGVGTARKIGMDFSLKYANKDSLLFSLDADTLVSKNYLKIISNKYHENLFNVCIVNFKHQKSKNSKINSGIKIYENALNHMAKKIKNCNSPYGYVSMGSTIICRVDVYIAVGGMPKRKAGEDFYFMQSLAKYTDIFYIDDILVFPSSRNEKRVYLGTGARMIEYERTNSFKNLFFKDSSYNIIKQIIFLAEKNYNKPYTLFNKELTANFNNKVCNFLNKHNLNDTWEKFTLNSKSKKQFMIFFHQWFDALKIIQLLKYI